MHFCLKIVEASEKGKKQYILFLAIVFRARCCRYADNWKFQTSVLIDLIYTINIDMFYRNSEDSIRYYFTCRAQGRKSVKKKVKPIESISYQMFLLNVLMHGQSGLHPGIDFRVEAAGAAGIRFVYSRCRGNSFGCAAAWKLVHR